MRQPAILHLRAISPADVFAQAVNVILGIPEDDREHELALGVILKAEGRKPKVFELLGIEEVDDAPAVDGISCKPIRMPGDDALGFSCCNALKHRIEYRTARRFGTH